MNSRWRCIIPSIYTVTYVPYISHIKDSSNESQSQQSQQSQQPHMIVIGNGWAGNTFIKHLDKSRYKITMIAPNTSLVNTTLFVKRLDQALSDKSSKFHSSSFKETSIFKGISFKEGQCTGINPVTREVTYMDMNMNKINILKYDELIIATGSVTNTYGIHNMDNYAYFFKTEQDLAKLIQRVKLATDKQKLKIIIIGTGAVGIELAFTLAKYAKVELIEAMDRILPSFTNNTAIKIQQELLENCMSVQCDTAVQSINAQEIQILNRKTHIPSRIPIDNNTIVIWAGGITANLIDLKSYIKYTTSTTSTTSTISMLPKLSAVDQSLKLNNYENIHLIGDVNMYTPASAQMSVQQAKYLAQKFNQRGRFNWLDSDVSFMPFTYYDQGRVLHTSNAIYYENNLFTLKLPLWIDPIVRLFTTN